MSIPEPNQTFTGDFAESNQTFACNFGEVINLTEQEKQDITDKAYKEGFKDGQEGLGSLTKYFALSGSMASAFESNRTITPEDIESVLPYGTTKKVKNFTDAFYRTSISRAPKLDIEGAEIISSMFYDCQNLKDVSQMNWKDCTNLLGGSSSQGGFASTFYNCKLLEETPNIDYAKNPKCGGLYFTFKGCSSLKKVNLIDARHMNSLNSTFDGCTNLEEVYITNLTSNMTIGSGTTYGHLIKKECLIFIIRGLIEQTVNRTLTMGSANLEKLANTYVRLVDITEEMVDEDEFIYQKKPFEICESTDEGAMLISNYVRLKKWQLA